MKRLLLERGAIGCSNETTEIEPGMVLPYEWPWYVRGLGAFMLENQFIIGADSSEPFWSLSRVLAICDC